MTYLPALIIASNALLETFSRDPTAYGISKGFVDTELLLESALVAYCGVIGDVFANRQSDRRKLVRSTRRNSMKDHWLITGGLGQNIKGSRVGTPGELARSQKQKIDGRRQTAPSDLGRKVSSVNLLCTSEAHTIPQLNRLDKEKPGLGGGLKRTMSLFKRKSLPPLPTISFPWESHSGPPSPRRSRTPSIFSLTPIVSRGSLMSLALGMSGASHTTPSPYAKHSPRPHAKSEPIPPPGVVLEQQGVQFPVSPVSSIGHLGPHSFHGHGSASSPSHEDHSQEKIPTARDLAILPTQRVTRFVLLFRGSLFTFFDSEIVISDVLFTDLLNHTPENSPTRPLVERALQGAIRIAEKCDRAQGNAAFLRMF
jgi:hypothetical protein